MHIDYIQEQQIDPPEFDDEDNDYWQEQLIDEFLEEYGNDQYKMAKR